MGIMPCTGNCTTKQRVPKNLNLDDQAEEILGPNNENQDGNPELGVPIRFARPEYKIVYLPRRVQIAEPKAVQTTDIPTADLVPEPEPGPAPPSPVPGPSSQQTVDMDTRERDRGHKKNKDNTDSEPEERKQLKIRPNKAVS